MRIALVLIMLFLASTAKASENIPFTATYALYTGGVRMVDVAINFDITPKKYTITADAKTLGIFEKILPWTGHFETTGTGNFKPLQHDYAVSWRGETSQSTFSYKPAGVFTSLTQTKNGKKIDEPIEADITNGTRDMLSSMLVMFSQYETTGKCASDVLTFDNARSFIIRFADKADGMLDNPNLSSFTGQAHACTVEIIPQKGHWPKKPRGWLRIQAEAKKGGKLPVIWMAKPAEGKPAIPVRIDIHTRYGDVIAHLAKLQ